MDSKGTLRGSTGRGSAAGNAGKHPRLIDVVFSPAELEKKDLTGKTALVIDVLRATTTIVTAIDNGAAEVIAVRTPEEALAGRDAARNAAGDSAPDAVWDASGGTAPPARGGEALAGGERGGVAPPGFDLGNSPLEYVPDVVRGKLIFLTTTNGTMALVGARQGGAAVVGVACFRNAGAAARWAAATGNDVVLICAGRRGQFSLEDTALAGLLASRLVASGSGGKAPDGWALSDAAQVACMVWSKHEGNIGGLLRDCEHGRFLASIGLVADLDVCAGLDVTATVPVLGDGTLAVAEIDTAEAEDERAGGIRREHGAGVEPDRLIAAVREAADDDRLPCAQAMALARRLRVPVRAVGDAANEARIKIAACQLGCFR